MTPALSIVLVAFDMAPQLSRTLLSFAPRWQRGAKAADLEVIVVDNGSTVPLTAQDVATEGLDVRLVSYGAPTVSPVAAANHGLSLARGEAIMMMIDGARLASPGLVAASLKGLALHPRAVVASYNYHLGRKAQQYAVAEGYDAAEEAALLASIDWPAGGERLFEIAVPEGEEGFPSPLAESNALVMRRAMWAELGGYDPAFSGPGGGACNPDLLVRACALPGARLVKLAGEATFHQVHGGTVTNTLDRKVIRQVFVEYAKIRGYAFRRVRGEALLFDPAAGTVTPQHL